MVKYSSALLFALVAASLPSGIKASCSNDQVNNNEDIVSRVCASENDDRFGTLCDLLRETNVDDIIRTGSDYTLFAPNNQAFNRAGNRAGVTRVQKTDTLLYHISSNDNDLSCGETRSSLLSGRTSITRCTDNNLDGQEGNVRIPTPSSGFPRFADSDIEIDACNGQIVELGDVMGFGPAVYNFGSPSHGTGCSFYDHSCKGSKGRHSPVFYGGKGSKGGRRWGNLNRYQSVYAYNWQGVFAPNYFNPYYQRPYYYNNFYPPRGRYYNGKGGKGRGRYYGGYGNRRRRHYYNPYYRNLEEENESDHRGSIRGRADKPDEEYDTEDVDN